MAKLKNIPFVLIILASWMLFVVASVAEDHVNQLEEQVLAESHDLVLEDVVELSFLVKFFKSLKGSSTYTHVWPEMEVGWRIIVGTLVAFCGAAFGSAGGIGAGGILVPVLTLIVGFDAKSSTAISKCMIMGLTGATIYHNIKQKHPTLNRPLIDYDLALVVQPVLLLGISTGVMLNLIFANWMITILLIIAFVGTSTRSFCKGIEMWKKETIKKKEAAQLPKSKGQIGDEIEYKPLPGGPAEQHSVPVAVDVPCKELGILIAVWLLFLAIQISKDLTSTCSATYWVLNVLQIPVAVGATLWQIVKLHRRRAITSYSAGGEVGDQWRKTQQLIICAFVALLAGTLGGMLGLGGGFLLAPMLLEIGIIPQVSSATVTFVMTFSSSMCAIQYYLLKRFPVPYALYFVAVAIIASLTGQFVVKRWIARVGRTSLIVFILSTIIFTSAVLLGGEGIVNMIHKIEHNEFMGFEDLCSYQAK